MLIKSMVFSNAWLITESPSVLLYLLNPSNTRWCNLNGAFCFWNKYWHYNDSSFSICIRYITTIKTKFLYPNFCALCAAQKWETK
jgi:hypothetical protein